MRSAAKRKATEEPFEIHRDRAKERAGPAMQEQNDVDATGEEDDLDSGCSEDDDEDATCNDKGGAVDGELEKFRSSFKGLSKRYRLIKRIGEGTVILASLVDQSFISRLTMGNIRNFLDRIQGRRYLLQQIPQRRP